MGFYSAGVPAFNEPDPPPQKLTLTKAEFESVNEPTVAGEPLSHDPMDILRQNRAQEKAAGTVFDQSPPVVKKKSRRLRDYLIILVIVDSLLGYAAISFSHDPYTFVPLVAGFLLFTSAFSWHMLVVIDDY